MVTAIIRRPLGKGGAQGRPPATADDPRSKNRDVRDQLVRSYLSQLRRMDDDGVTHAGALALEHGVTTVPFILQTP